MIESNCNLFSSLSTTSTGPGTAGSCPAGWMSGSTKCYLIQTDATDHSTAVTQCNMYNATLVSVSSRAEWVRLLAGDLLISWFTGIFSSITSDLYEADLWGHCRVVDNLMCTISPLKNTHLLICATTGAAPFDVLLAFMCDNGHNRCLSLNV